jgi:type VII secretion-associated serine protease mycosin
MTRLAVGTAISLLSLLAAVPAAAETPAAEQWALDARHFDSARTWTLSTGRGVVVAVVDSGVDAHHPDLAGRVLPGVDLVGDAGDGRVDSSSNSHGTSVAAIIAADGSGAGGMTGLAPGATILPVRISDDLASDPATLARGIDYATTHGAKVINISVCASILNPQVRTAVDAAIRQDVVVVAAAGNDGLKGNPPQYPAALPGVLAVAASDARGSLWPDSESGAYLGLTAPGVDIYTAGLQGSHQQASGTSFAAPEVAAAAALLRSRFPDESATQIITRLTSTAHSPRPGRSTQWGFGIIDPYRALTAGAHPAVADPLSQPAIGAPKAADAETRTGPGGTVIILVVAILAVIGAVIVVFVRRQRTPTKS